MDFLCPCGVFHLLFGGWCRIDLGECALVFCVGAARKFFVTGVKYMDSKVVFGFIRTGVKYMDSKVEFWFYS